MYPADGKIQKLSVLGWGIRSRRSLGVNHRHSQSLFFRWELRVGQMCSAGDVNFVSSSIGSRFLPLVTPRGNSLCCASSWLESLLFSGLVHSSLWCLTCLGRQPARWVVYRFHFWPNGSEDERMWDASGWRWGWVKVDTNHLSRDPQWLWARHWISLNEQTAGPSA